jgi:MFS family permease
MTVGSCLGTALLIAWSRVESLAGFYVIWTLMGFALAATLYEPAFGAVVRWFPTEHRDRALTIVTLAGALASTIFMPIAAWLVEHGGWRQALLVLAAILAVLTFPPHAVVLRRQPRISIARPTAPGPAQPGAAAAPRSSGRWRWPSRSPTSRPRGHPA